MSTVATPISACTSPKGPMGCRYHSRFVSAEDIFSSKNLRDNTEDKNAFMKEWFGQEIKTVDAPETDNSKLKLSNKGEHSEALFTLRILSGTYINEADGTTFESPQIQFDRKNVWYEKETLFIENEGEIRGYPAPNLPELADKMESEIKEGTGTFRLKDSEWYYNALAENGINPKAPSSSKSDIYVTHLDEDGKRISTGISIKSMLGSAPSILNANGHATAFTYEVSGYDNLTDEQLREVYVPDVMKSLSDGKSSVNFSQVENPHFKEIFTKSGLSEDKMANAVLTWKQGKSPSITTLIDKKDKPQFQQFFKKVMTTENVTTPSTPLPKSQYSTQIKEYLAPQMLGRIEKNGVTKLTSFEEAFDNLYLDAPSKTRHNYGYLYREDGKVKMKISIGVRSK